MQNVIKIYLAFDDCQEGFRGISKDDFVGKMYAFQLKSLRLILQFTQIKKLLQWSKEC